MKIYLQNLEWSLDPLTQKELPRRHIGHWHVDSLGEPSANESILRLVWWSVYFADQAKFMSYRVTQTNDENLQLT